MKAVILVALLCLASALCAESGFGLSNVAEFDTADPVLTLSSPLGGEVWYIGENYDIQWAISESHLSLNSIFLFYSTDAGETYNIIEDFLGNSGSYSWEIPSDPTTQAKVRILANDTFGNTGQAENESVFELRYMKLKAPEGLTISINDGTDAYLEWEPVYETVNDVPLEPDGYWIFQSQTPNEEDFSYLATSFVNLYNHADATGLYPRSFYYIVAYKDVGGKLAAQLEQLISLSRMGLKRVSLKDILALLDQEGGGE